MHQRMLNDGFEPDAYTFVPLFKACGNILDLETGIKLHDVAKTQGFTSHMIVLTALLSMYANCNALEEAETIFNCFSQPDVVCWNAMLSAYVNHGEGVKALRLYLQMHEEGMCPTIQTVIIAIQACGVIVEEVDRQTALEISCTLHAYARKRGFISHEFVHTTLVSVYGKCGRIEYAENVFTEQPVHHLSLWNGMISAYVDQGSIDKALQLFWQMVSERVSPDQRTYVLALQACISCMKMDPKMHTYSKHFQMLIQEVGEALHADAVSAGFLCDVFVVTSLVTFYGRCRLPEKAEEVFCRLGQSTAVVWNALLCAYIEGGLAERALGMLKRMKEDSVLLDATSILCILQGCNDAGTLDLCLELHFAIVSLEQDSDLFLRSALIHTYGGCADIKDAEWVFHGFPYQDVATWNAHSTGCVMDGNMMASACLFEELHLAGLRPDGVTYAAVISACNHAGKVDEALEYFMMMDWFHNILPDSKHLVSITDLLGRAGDFTRLESVLQIMSKEHIDPSTWLFLLGACRTHGNLNLAKEAFEYAVGLKPKQATAYISMSNIYAEAGITDQFLESG
ncbi:hypothetical protein KP509_05G023000 [Ceratopteris richardii]|nr:hypothetical protein KP509_05G023000 [Ceratopteris richardii]